MTRSEPTRPALELHGRRALVRLGARLSGVYLIGTAVGVAAVLGTEDAPFAGVPVAAQVVGLGLVITIAINCTGSPWPGPRGSRRPALWANLLRAVAVAAGTGVLARIVASGEAISWPAVHTLACWALPAVGLGLALAAGPAWGAAGFAVLGVAFAAMVPTAEAAAVLATLAAAAVSVVVAAVINVTARRGFTITEAVIRAAQATDAARVHAEQRLLARRRLDRVLHDTVLSTLTLLAHSGAGVPADQVRRECRRDLAALRSGRWPVPEQAPEADSRAAGSGAGGALAGCVHRRAAPFAERLDAVRELAAHRGVDLRVHVQAPVAGPPVAGPPVAGPPVAGPPAAGPPVAGPPAAGPYSDADADAEAEAGACGGLDAGALEAWTSALAECVRNITRHAGVTAADVVLGVTDDALVTLVVDEGVGFDPAAVRSERLGLSGSVHGQLHDVGGRARVWSRPGQGTVVELMLPWPRRSPGTPPQARRPPGTDPTVGT